MIEEEEILCCVCGKSVREGMVLHKGSLSSERSFIYLNVDECAHIECYIDLCVQKSLEKFQRYKP